MAATPLYFGDSDRKLYGVFHGPTTRRSNAPAVLMFNPFGEEAIRSYRTYRQLAERLSRAGASVLRFDYYGSGDSAGDCADLDLDGMVRDAVMAHEELEAMTELRRFAWVGLGLGGAVALCAARATGANPAQLFLWDPVLNGADYLAVLRGAHIAALSHALDLPASRIKRDTPKEPAKMTEALGFHLSDTLRSQLLDFAFDDRNKIAREICLIASSDTSISPSREDILRSAAAHYRRYDSASTAWNSNEAFNEYYIPTDVIDIIVDGVSARS